MDGTHELLSLGGAVELGDIYVRAYIQRSHFAHNIAWGGGAVYFGYACFM